MQGKAVTKWGVSSGRYFPVLRTHNARTVTFAAPSRVSAAKAKKM